LKFNIQEILKHLAEKAKLLDEIAREKASGTIEYELVEMEHVFAILVLGAFVGLPSPPMQITLNLLPEMEKELMLLFRKTETANEPLSTLFSIFDVS
jgi:hypothetical protein